MLLIVIAMIMCYAKFMLYLCMWIIGRCRYIFVFHV